MRYDEIEFPVTVKVTMRTIKDLLMVFPNAELPTVKHCIRCERPFPCGQGTNRRSDAIYCTPKCQSADAYRIRCERTA